MARQPVGMAAQTGFRLGLACCLPIHHSAGNSGSRRDAEEILYHLLPKGITVFAFDFAVSAQKRLHASSRLLRSPGPLDSAAIHAACATACCFLRRPAKWHCRALLASYGRLVTSSAMCIRAGLRPV